MGGKGGTGVTRKRLLSGFRDACASRPILGKDGLHLHGAFGSIKKIIIMKPKFYV